MKVGVENKGPCRKLIAVEVPADAVNSGYNEILQMYKKAAKIPGFRKGKAPESIVEKTYTKEINEDVKERLLPSFYRQAINDKGIKPVAVVEINNVDFNKKKGLSFSVTVDVAPEFKLAKYKKIALKGESIDVTETDVNEAVGRLRESFSRFEDVHGRTVRSGDLVLIDYTGTIDGQPVGGLAPEASGLGGAKDFWALMDKPEFLPGFIDGVIGMDVGEKKELDVHFPDDYRVTQVAGKNAVYIVILKGIREKVLPELNEALFKKLEVDSEEALRRRIRDDIQKAKEQAEKSRLKNEISRVLLDKISCDLPESIVEQEVQMTVRSTVQNMIMQGMTRDRLNAQSEDLIKKAREVSAERVRLSYILNRIGDEEGIEVSDTELEKSIGAMAIRYGISPAQLRAEMEKNDRIEGLLEEIRANKTLDTILEYAKIKK